MCRCHSTPGAAHCNVFICFAHCICSNVDYLETWQAMERLVATGKVKSIGVSNFNSEQIGRLLSAAHIAPAVNQVECSPQINQTQLTRFCRERNIAVTGFCPLGHPNPAARTPDFMYDARVRAIADKYGKSPAQIGLRYLVSVSCHNTTRAYAQDFDAAIIIGDSGIFRLNWALFRYRRRCNGSE